MQSTGAWRYHRFCSNIGVLIVHMFVCLPEMCGAAAAYSWLELFFLFLGWLSPWARGCSLRVGSAPSALSTLPTQREREREQPLAQGESQPKKRKKRKKRKKLVKTHAKRGKKQMVRKTEEEKKEKMKT